MGVFVMLHCPFNSLAAIQCLVLSSAICVANRSCLSFFFSLADSPKALHLPITVAFIKRYYSCLNPIFGTLLLQTSCADFFPRSACYSATMHLSRALHPEIVDL